jgi:UDP-galactopyranose mutase
MEFPRYIIVGSGFFGSVLAERISNIMNENVLVIEKRNHVGGNCYSEIEKDSGIEFHKYGTHIFHTDNRKVWDYITEMTEFNGYYHQVLTTYRGKVYQMPINLETINSYYEINLRPYEVTDFLEKEISKEGIINPGNFEEKAISLIGRPLYEAFIKGYTRKQWQQDPIELPVSILNRLPFRKNYNENYYFSRWQGIPIDGYTAIFNKMLSSPLIELKLNTDFFSIKDQIPPESKVFYSGPIDRYFEYKFGRLDWRSLRFEMECLDYEDFQGTSVMNYADEGIPYTRIHEPKHLHPERNYKTNKTITIKEYSVWDDGSNPYYPVNNEKNNNLLMKYKTEAVKQKNIVFSGRLGDYKYYDMHQTIAIALEKFEELLKS